MRNAKWVGPIGKARLLPVAGWALVFAALMTVLSPTMGLTVKGLKNNLDALSFSRPELRVSVTPAEADSIGPLVPNLRSLDMFRAENGDEWRFVMDQRTGRLNLLDGGAIPFIPGTANSLKPDDFGVSCDNASCVPAEKMESLARNFLHKYSEVFQVDPNDLVLDPLGSNPVGNSIYFLRFQWTYANIPVEGASVFFRINNGNLIQVATENVGPISLDPTPSITPDYAWDILRGYLGGDFSEKDIIVNRGSLSVLPITPRGFDPDVFAGGFGEQIDYLLVYKLAFRRPDVSGTWEATVDARTGEILRFVDTDRYGHVQGGIRPSDGLPPEEFRPFPFADTGQASPNNYTDGAGNFTGNNATVTLTGKYAHIADSCGSISATTTTGDINFGSGATGTDCTVPAGNTYGAGNTKPSRTLFYNVTAINLKAQTYAPSNTWLTSNYVTLHVNGTAECNARSGGADIYFYKQIAGSCNNLGEVPGVAMHEWAHSYDTNDGSGGQTPPLETYADFTAIIQTHNSCTGAGFLIGSNCGGYGNPCTACTGVRDCDYHKHNPATPWTSSNHTTGTPNPPTTVWGCSSGSYNGPCGWEDHCESGISTQALWDFVNEDLVAAPTSMDLTSAWMLEDRLWFAGVASLTKSYNCASGVTDGCTGNVLYTVMRAIDDDGDGTANGTPHAAAIFSALKRHNIACGAAGDAANQNHVSSSCPSMTVTTLSATAGSNQATVSWSTVTGATRYFVFRNESGCDVAFSRVATVSAPTTQYVDNAVVNGVTYYYRYQAATANDSCTSAVSNCATVTPMPCAGSVGVDNTRYSCAGTVNVSVLDSTPGASPWTAEAWSTTDATHKTVTLANVPPGSATYTGSFTTTSGTAGPSQVRVSNGDTLTVQYTDTDWCGTGSHAVTTTATTDCAAPVISNVQVTGVTDSSAVVTWTTNELANSRVTYGTATPPGTNKDDPANFVTSHSITLTGLTGCTKVYFSVTSADVAANGATDANGGTYYSFTTAGRTFVMGPDNVEGGVLSWVVSPATGTNIWHQDTCKAVSGTHAWKVGKSDAPTCTAQYDANLSNYYLTWNANVALGASGHGYHLRFNEWYDTESNTGCTYDPLRTQISTDGGASWTTLATNCGASGGWIARDYDLAAYTGSLVRIRFYFTSDSSANGLGWYVDDINISKTQSCTAEMSYLSNTFDEFCSGGGAGSPNGIIDSGEDITVHPTVKNVGSQGATGISATLSTSTPGITVTGAAATYPDLAVGASAACNAPHFSYSVGTGVACGTVISFTLTITAATGGGPWTQTFTHIVGHFVAGTPTTVFTEGFDGTTFPPTGWTLADVSGTAANWARVTTSTNPTGINPHNASTAMAELNSYHATSGTSERLARTANISVPAGATAASAVLWVYHETGYVGYTDQIQVQTSPDGTTWTNRGMAINRYDGSTGWREHTVDLSALIGAGSFRIGYLGVSNYGNDTYMDDVSVAYTPGSCTMTPCTPAVTPPGETAPGNTLGTAQSWTNKTTQTWPANATATSYTLYRGILSDLPQLLNSSTDSCTKYTGTANSTASITEDPTAITGRFYWYLVTGSNTGGEGPPGNATAGARTVNSSGTCP